MSFSVFIGPQLGLHVLPNAVDLARFIGVFIFVRRYCTRYDKNLIFICFQKLEIFFGLIYVLAIHSNTSV